MPLLELYYVVFDDAADTVTFVDLPHHTPQQTPQQTPHAKA